MSTIAVDTRLARSVRFYSTTVGKKAVMAVTGLIMVGFVVAHMAGNLQFFGGAEPMNHYAVLLRTVPEVLWLARAVLLLSVVLHIVAYAQLLAIKNAARPVNYVKRTPTTSTWASRTMYWSGPIIAAFIVYHILHLTLGVVHPAYQEMKPYENLVSAFHNPIVALVYIGAMLMLWPHLRHGIFSMFQSIGANHPKYSPMLRSLAVVISTVVVLGFISIPFAVLIGLKS